MDRDLYPRADARPPDTLIAMILLRAVFLVMLSTGMILSADPALESWLSGLARAQWTARREKVNALRTPAEIRVRQEFVRKWLSDAIGGLPPKTPLNAKITGTLQRGDYRVEKLIFESMPRFFVTANVYVPARAGRFPAVLGVAGHSDTGKSIDTYQHVWISLAKRGFVVLAFDPPGQGERSEYFDAALGKSKVGIGTREHIMAGLQCLLTGTTFARYEINDGVRALDYLLTRPDVDPRRIAIAGNSGGGTQAAYLAVLEPRLAAAVTSCYITSWETLWHGPGPQDSEQIFPDFLHDGLDFGDFLLAFAPKPIQMTTATQDFFPIAGARATYAEAERLFKVADAPGRVGYFEYDDKHGWSQPRREASYRWFAKWLQNEDSDSGVEPPHTIEAEADLNATTTGQVATSLGGETVWSLNRALAKKQFASRAALRSTPEQLRSIIAARLRIVPPTPPRIGAALTASAPVTHEGYTAQPLKVRTEGGLELPAVLFQPVPAAAKSRAVIWVDSDGRAAALAEIERTVRAGAIVLAIDLRGIGELGSPAPPRSGYNPQYQLAMRALLVGKNLPGMQVTDILHAFEYLRAREDVDPAKVRIATRGLGVNAGLLAAALEPAVSGLSADRPPMTFLEIAETQILSGIADLVVPGALQDFDLTDVLKLVPSRHIAAEIR